jgi:hypothetical protein
MSSFDNNYLVLYIVLLLYTNNRQHYGRLLKKTVSKSLNVKKFPIQKLDMIANLLVVSLTPYIIYLGYKDYVSSVYEFVTIYSSSCGDLKEHNIQKYTELYNSIYSKNPTEINSYLDSTNKKSDDCIMELELFTYFKSTARDDPVDKFKYFMKSDQFNLFKQLYKEHSYECRVNKKTCKANTIKYHPDKRNGEQETFKAYYIVFNLMSVLYY